MEMLGGSAGFWRRKQRQQGFPTVRHSLSFAGAA
jgi:hypothetical protein